MGEDIEYFFDNKEDHNQKQNKSLCKIEEEKTKTVAESQSLSAIQIDQIRELFKKTMPEMAEKVYRLTDAEILEVYYDIKRHQQTDPA